MVDDIAAHPLQMLTPKPTIESGPMLRLRVVVAGETAATAMPESFSCLSILEASLMAGVRRVRERLRVLVQGRMRADSRRGAGGSLGGYGGRR